MNGMDRFSQLEFEEVNPERKRAQGEAIRDAGYFFKQALKYWLAGEFDLALRNYSRVLERNRALLIYSPAANNAWLLPAYGKGSSDL